LFRQQAIKHISSPDDLDQVITITNAQGWAVLAALGLLVAFIIGWTFLAQIPITVSGSGAFEPVGGVAELVSFSAGQVVDFSVPAGGAVKQGQKIGSVDTGSGSTDLVSPIDGVITEILRPRWSPVERNGVVARLRPDGSQTAAVVYVPAATGASIQAGMAVQISPSSQTGQSSGFLKGTVVRVADAPASRQQVLRVLTTEDEVEDLFRSTPLPLRIDVALDRQDGQYVWSSAQGNDQLVRSGLLLTAGIVLGETAPVALVIPRGD
jgi:hypothetical protein